MHVEVEKSSLCHLECQEYQNSNSNNTMIRRSDVNWYVFNKDYDNTEKGFLALPQRKDSSSSKIILKQI